MNCQPQQNDHMDPLSHNQKQNHPKQLQKNSQKHFLKKFDRTETRTEYGIRSDRFQQWRRKILQIESLRVGKGVGKTLKKGGEEDGEMPNNDNQPFRERRESWLGKGVEIRRAPHHHRHPPPLPSLIHSARFLISLPLSPSSTCFTTLAISSAPTATSTPLPTSSHTPTSSTTSFQLLNCSEPSGHRITGTPQFKLASTEFHLQWLTNDPVAGCFRIPCCGAHFLIRSLYFFSRTRSSNPSQEIPHPHPVPFPLSLPSLLELE